jgi:thymidylate synthase
MNIIDAQYEEFLNDILNAGTKKGDRTGTGTTSMFGYQMRFDLADGFPLITTKKVHLKSIVAELLWFLSGSSNNNDLRALGCTIWDEWAKPDGDLGPVYGVQWRSWPTGGYNSPTIDQISEAIHLLKTDPDSRRIIVSAWNVAELKKMALMPCHALFQFYTRELALSEREALFVKQMQSDPDQAPRDQYMLTMMSAMPAFLDVQRVPRRALSCQLYQRSADAFLGVPFNIASYALLTHMMAQQCNMVADEFIWTGGDCHVYNNHREQVELQLSRDPRPFPKLKLARKPNSIFDYKAEDFVIEGYDPHPAIKAPVAV